MKFQLSSVIDKMCEKLFESFDQLPVLIYTEYYITFFDLVIFSNQKLIFLIICELRII